MPTLTDYYEYAKLATAAYVNMDEFPSFNASDFAIQANSQGRLPTALGEATFVEGLETNPDPVWTIPDFGPNRNGYYGNDDSGFAATLFEKDEEKTRTSMICPGPMPTNWSL